jgi:hypothetical protein
MRKLAESFQDLTKRSARGKAETEEEKEIAILPDLHRFLTKIESRTNITLDILRGTLAVLKRSDATQAAS